MERIDRILAVIDPTVDVHPGAAKAARLAHACGATLELFICDFDSSLADQRFSDSEALRDLREDFFADRVDMLEELADELRTGGLEIETHVHWDNPLFKGILRRIGESRPDLVVKDTHHHALLRRTVISNTDWNLIRSCPVPLLLAKSGGWPAHPRLLAAVDPGHTGDKSAAVDHDILAATLWLAGRLDGEAKLVHAFFPAALLAAVVGMAGVPLAADFAATGIVDAARTEAEEAVHKLAAEHGMDLSNALVVQGTPIQALPAQAELLAADITVMGAVSRSRLQEVFIGSSAERVLERMPCDVLVIKPADFSEGLPF